MYRFSIHFYNASVKNHVFHSFNLLVLFSFFYAFRVAQGYQLTSLYTHKIAGFCSKSACYTHVSDFFYAYNFLFYTMY
jgi:hypothetical protein